MRRDTHAAEPRSQWWTGHHWEGLVPVNASAAAAMVLACVLVGGCASSPEQLVDDHDRPGSTPQPTLGPPGVQGPFATDGGEASASADPPRDGADVGSDDWRVGRAASNDEIAGYTTRTSGPEGTRVGLKVSTAAARWQVVAYRIGAYQGGWGHRIWQSTYQEGRVQPDAILDPVETRTVVAPWRRSLTIDTGGWPAGFYALKLRTGSGFEKLVPYVVSSESAEGTVALVAPVTTWQAYNAWGGYSLYEGPDGEARSWAVSFDRPFGGYMGANDFRTAAFPIVVRAEQLGVPLSYFTNVDIHARPGVLTGARGYVSMGHDEYWTTTMRRQVMQARDAGTNLAFLGANTMYWRIRLSDGPSGPNRTVTGYRDDAYADPLRDEQPEETTSRFRDPPAARPEQDLIGMQYECYPVDADYVIVSPRWWGFQGTGLGYGDRVPGLVGPEADRVYPGARTPRPLQILSNTTYDCRGVTTSTQSSYYTSDSGAGVFTAGTLRWGCALVDTCDRPLGARVSRFVGSVTDNVLREFATGPVGTRHPARDNIDDFDLPVANLVSAS